MTGFLPNAGTLAVLALVILAAVLAFRSWRRNRGNPCACGCGGCAGAHSPGSCHRKRPIERPNRLSATSKNGGASP